MKTADTPSAGVPGVESKAGDRDSAPYDEALRFERALAEVSAGFINIPAAQVDTAITGALRHIAQLLDVDRLTLVRAYDDGSIVVTHSGSVDGVMAVPANYVPSYPWTLGELRQGRHVAFSTVSDLPDEAKVDRANWTLVGVYSNLTVPIVVGGAFEGALALACLRHPRRWPDELIGRVRTLATILGNALAHKRDQAELAVAMRFERLMSQALASTMTAPPNALDDAIATALRDAADVLGADRATLWQRTADGTDLLKTHRWVAPGVPTPPDVTGMARLPWVMSEVLANRSVSVSSADLPTAAASDATVLEALRARSFVVAPLAIGGTIAGALSFASTRDKVGWPQSLVPRVQLFGEMLASVLARARAQRSELDARAEAAHAARLGTIGVVAASLAHELTQPLAAIMTNAETARALITAETIDHDELRATIEDILADDRRAVTLIHQLRRFLRRDELERAAIDVRAMLQEVLQLVRGEAVGKNVVVRLDANAPLPAVMGNRAQVQQVMLNLLLNAFDALAANASSRRVDVVAKVEGPRVIVEVADNGPGMDDAAQARAFAPFYTTKPKGMGLGLSISRSIAESHGGALMLRSTPGQGSAFRIELPAMDTSGK